MTKRQEIIQKKDGYYVRINDGEKKYDTGPLPSLEEAQARADRELLVGAARGFSWRDYFKGLALVETFMIGASILGGLDFGWIAIMAALGFVIQGTFSVLILIRLNQ